MTTNSGKWTNNQKGRRQGGLFDYLKNLLDDGLGRAGILADDVETRGEVGG